MCESFGFQMCKYLMTYNARRPFFSQLKNLFAVACGHCEHLFIDNIYPSFVHVNITSVKATC